MTKTFNKLKETGHPVEDEYKYRYLIVIPFFGIAFLLFIIFARYDTITHYVQHAHKKDALHLLKLVIKNKDDKYYNKKYKEIRKNGYFWSGKPKEMSVE